MCIAYTEHIFAHPCIVSLCVITTLLYASPARLHITPLRWEEAVRDYRAVLEVAPEDPAAWNNLGNATAGKCLTRSNLGMLL